MVEQEKDEFLWSQKYRPRKVSDCILPTDMKKNLQAIVDSREIHNMMLVGTAGTGKTTVAKAICDELELDYIVVNSSLNGNIDTLRNEIQEFSSTMSMVSDGPKVVILDEFDHSNQNSTQAALRGFMETFSKTTRFIITANFPNRIIDPIHSRTTKIDFKFPKETKQKLAAQFFGRCKTILDQEGVEYDEAVLVSLVMKHFPDFRKILNELQRYSASGKIDKGILANRMDASISDLRDVLKAQDYSKMRKWVSDNSDNDLNVLWSSFYKGLHEHVKDENKPDFILILGKYQYQSGFVPDAEINLCAFLVEVVSNIEIV